MGPELPGQAGIKAASHHDRSSPRAVEIRVHLGWVGTKVSTTQWRTVLCRGLKVTTTDDTNLILLLRHYHSYPFSEKGTGFCRDTKISCRRVSTL